MDPERLLDGLDDAQRDAVTSPANPLCVHAGAGSGKTRVLTRRIAHRAATGDLDPRHTLALTFTRKAAGELRSRLHALGLHDDVAAGTFHATAYAQLRARWADLGTDPPRLLDRKMSFVADLLGRERDRARAVVAEIEWAAARRVRPEDYLDRATRAGRRPPLGGEGMPRFLNLYSEAKAEQRFVDFDDLLRLATRLMTQDPEAAAAYRWRFRHLVVDEFQDVNPLQYDLLHSWLGDGDDLFVVGDPHQAIYGWNGADARYLDHFDRAYPPERYPGVEVLHLRDNHRSSPQVLATAAAVLSTSRLVPHRPDGPLPVVVEHADAEVEAQAIARDLRQRHAPGRPWSAQAVLVRTNALAAVIARALGRAEIPYRLRGTDQLLGRPVVAAALRRLRRERYEAVLADLRSGEPPEGSDDPERDLEDRATLVVLSHEYETFESQPSGSGFASWLTAAVRSGDSDGADRDAVEISTFHAAKGLEWPIVHLAGLEDGLVPVSYATSDEAKDEERRLLYVAVTRAQEEVRFNWARRRVAPSGDEREQQPSPWLADVEAAIGRLAEEAQPVDGRHHLDRPRAELTARHPVQRTPADDALTRLEAWRAHAARAGRVEASAILDDVTLRALAEARPTSTTELSAIPGLGPVKIAHHGDDLLAAIRPVRLVEP